MQITTTSMEEADLTQPEAMRDSEQQALPLQEPTIEGYKHSGQWGDRY